MLPQIFLRKLASSTFHWPCLPCTAHIWNPTRPKWCKIEICKDENISQLHEKSSGVIICDTFFYQNLQHQNGNADCIFPCFFCSMVCWLYVSLCGSTCEENATKKQITIGDICGEKKKRQGQRGEKIKFNFNPHEKRILVCVTL